MHKKPLKRSTFNPLRHKIEAPEHLSALQDYQCKQSESSSRIRLPSLHRRKSVKENDSNASAWDKYSTATAGSWSPELEDAVTSRVVEQWEAIERTLYDEEDQIQQTALLEECLQWKSQIPHLRIVGRNPLSWAKSRVADSKQSSSAGQGLNIQSDDLFSEHSFSGKESSISTRSRSQKKAKEEVFNIIVDYVMSEFFPNKENKIDDTLEDSLDNMLRISPATLHSSRSSAKSKRNTWSEENPLNSFSENYTEQDDFVLSVDEESAKSNAQEADRKTKASENLETKTTAGHSDDDTSERVSRSLATRNKLGTVFNEKIVVTPVPYVLSTRESFCTLRTTPIKFIPQPLTASALPGSGRNISGFKYSARNSVASKLPDGYSAWHAPVCPTVWPKNIKLAPIDTSRLPRSKNRSASQAPVLRSNRKSLSPIQRPGLSVSAYTVRKNSNSKKVNNNDILQIQAKHITPAERPKQSACMSGKNYSSGIETSRKKKSRAKPEV